MKKICLISFSNNADYQDIIYSMFEELKHKTEVHTIGIKNPKCEFAQHTKYNHYYNCPLRPGITKGTFRFIEIFRIARMIKRERITHLFFESQHIWNAFLMLLCMRCVKVVVVHDVVPHDNNHAMTVSNYVTSHLADYVVVPNKKYRNDLAQKYRIRKERIKYMRFWKQFPEEHESVNSGVFLCFGRIRKYKGIQQLVDVVKKLPYVHFKVVGEPDEESIPLVEELKRYHNVEVCDREVTNEELDKEIEGADWVLLPYSAATQSGVIMDAYRFSKPVIAFDVGAIAEQVKHGFSGFLVEAGNIEAYAETIKKASRMDREELNKMSHGAYKFGYEMYSVEKLADSFMEKIYEMRH